MAERKLTPKQALFVKEYLIDLNATQAAIRAGYAPNNASEQAYQLLRKTTVADAIAAAQAERAEKCEIDALWVLKEAKSTYEAARQDSDLKAATSALRLVGIHVDVQAFKEKVEHDATDNFVDALTKARGRVKGNPDEV